ncbi:MAG: histidine kinase dimerization/phospho-acceptor domain-containing protein, partial [Woeseiaceae bacterium]|nr:histidine kinase dimerization/phospho-acceptor domain-containing protein [Woeseiaceae bacterium]
MNFPRPRTLNGLILVGFGLVALPLLLAVLWALWNLDRLAEQSEQLVAVGMRAAENNRLLTEDIGRLERAARQHTVIRSDATRELLLQDLSTIEGRLEEMQALTEQASATAMLIAIGTRTRTIVEAMTQRNLSAGEAQTTVAQFATLRDDVSRLTRLLSTYVDLQMQELQERTQNAQTVAAWQAAALVPGTLILVLFFAFLVARPIRQIDRAIRQLGESGFSKPIEVHGPRDLERLGRQLEWLRLRLLELAQEKNRFLRHMSHELKTPLANIREGTELLLDGTVGELDAPQREVTDILRHNGLKLQQLIENLLSFSAWQTKSEILTLTDFPLRAQVISVAKAQRLALKA